MPPVGASPVRVTVPVDWAPLSTVLGERVRLAGVGGVTVRVAVAEYVPAEAVMTTGVDFAIGEVDIEKDALFAPWGTVTVAGGVAIELFADNVTIRPPVGAKPFKVTVPVELPPPTT
jgi:hypothetical protein